MEASIPTWWELEKCVFFIRISVYSRNRVPINTCIPWNPVAIKKQDPNAESAIENEASLYSIIWIKEKYVPKRIVMVIYILAWDILFLDISAWWATVTVMPDDKRIKVLSKGINIKLNVWIPEGGHVRPINWVGFNEVLKNAQKKEKNSITSDRIKRSIPICRALTVFFVWSPIYVASRATSRHHKNIIIIRTVKEKKIIV